MKISIRLSVCLSLVVFAAGNAAQALAQANTPPAFGPFVVPLVMDENGQYAFTFVIVDDAPGNVTLSVTADNPAVAPPSSLEITGAGSDRTVSYRPPLDASGPVQFLFVLSDPTPVVGLLIGTEVRVATAVPRAPANLSTVTSASEVVFSWLPPSAPGPTAPSDLPSYYLLEVGEAPGLTAFPAIRVPARVDRVSLPLPRGGYTYRLRPGNRLGLGALSDEGSVGHANGPNVPGPPAGLSISIAAGRATATWVPPGFGASPLAYILEVGTAAGRSDIGRFTLPAGARSASGRVPPGTYALRIKAASAAGEGPPSPDVFLTVPSGSCDPPAAPALSPVLRNGSFLMVPWSAPPTGQAADYRLLAGTSPGASDLAVVPVLGGSSFVYPAPGAGTYHLTVQALSACAPPATSNPVTYVEPVPARPGAPRGLSATTGPGTASLSWNPPVTGGAVDDYVLEAGFNPSATDIVAPLVGTLPAISFSGVPSGTYFVRVRARNERGLSDASEEIALVVP
jgi:hypothetical protein